MKRILVVSVALFALVLAPLPAAAAGPARTPVGMKILDVAAVRPLSAVGSVVSTAFFLGTLPFTFITGVADPSAYLFVVAPWRFTSSRYLGDFESYQDGGDVFGVGASDY
jgi:hypothetical protein